MVVKYLERFEGWRGRGAACLVMGLLAVPASATDVPTQRTALGGQCALGWVYGHRILTDCSITWLDTRTDDTYCFTTRTARERFVKAASENIERAQAHYRAAHPGEPGTAAAASTAAGL